MEIPKVNAPKTIAPKVAEQKRNAIQDIIDQFNNKFVTLTNQLTGFVAWTNQAVRKFDQEDRKLAVQMSVQDIAITSVVKILIEKGLMTEEEYKNTAQVLYSQATEEEKK